MFLIRHEQVSVVRFAVQHARDARPANALFARDRYFNAVRGKDLDHRFVWWYEESLDGAGELEFEALVLGDHGRRGRKILSVNAATAPTEMFGGALDEIKEDGRTARIKMGVGIWPCKHGVHSTAPPLCHRA